MNLNYNPCKIKFSSSSSSSLSAVFIKAFFNYHYHRHLTLIFVTRFGKDRRVQIGAVTAQGSLCGSFFNRYIYTFLFIHLANAFFSSLFYFIFIFNKSLSVSSAYEPVLSKKQKKKKKKEAKVV